MPSWARVSTVVVIFPHIFGSRPVSATTLIAHTKYSRQVTYVKGLRIYSTTNGMDVVFDISTDNRGASVQPSALTFSRLLC